MFWTVWDSCWQLLALPDRKVQWWIKGRVDGLHGLDNCNILYFYIFSIPRSGEGRSVLSRFSKNYLPILFNLYTEPDGRAEHKAPLLDCVKAYVSISGEQYVIILL